MHAFEVTIVLLLDALQLLMMSLLEFMYLESKRVLSTIFFSYLLKH
jgi:hypothetical protein